MNPDWAALIQRRISIEGYGTPLSLDAIRAVLYAAEPLFRDAIAAEARAAEFSGEWPMHPSDFIRRRGA